MGSRKRKFAAVIIVLMLALAIGGGAYILSQGSLGGAGREPAGTWSVEASFLGSPVSDFTITVQNLKRSTHYEFHVDGVQIGERVTLDDSIRSVPLVFSKPELMEVWFFDSEDAREPIAKAGCDQSGILIFLGSKGSFKNDNNAAPGKSDDENGRSALPAEKQNISAPEPAQKDGKKNGGGPLDGLKRWLREMTERVSPKPDPENREKELTDEVDPDLALPVEDNPSENNNGTDYPETDHPGEKPSGKWSVEPDTPPTAKFNVSVVNIDPQAYYELHVSGIMIGERVPLGTGIRSISLMFSEPSLLKVSFFNNWDSTSLLAVAECADDGDMIFIK